MQAKKLSPSSLFHTPHFPKRNGARSPTTQRQPPPAGTVSKGGERGKLLISRVSPFLSSLTSSHGKRKRGKTKRGRGGGRLSSYITRGMEKVAPGGAVRREKEEGGKTNHSADSARRPSSHN